MASKFELNNSTPAAPAGRINIVWQSDANGNVSGNIPEPSAGGGVASVFGRTGAVAAQPGDYTAAQVTNAVSVTGSYADPAWITSLDWAKINNKPAIPNQTPWTSHIDAAGFELRNAGRIGIGTAAPASKVSLGSGASNIAQRIAVFEYPDGTGFRGIGMANPSAGVFGVGVYAGGATPTDTNMALFAADDGKIGIGTSNPFERLVVRTGVNANIIFGVFSGKPFISATTDGGGAGVNLILNAYAIEFFPERLIMAALPASNPGAGTKQLFYDPADGNRVKFAA